MAKRTTVENVDPALLSRIATLSPGGQRWLKTAIHTMRTMPVGSENVTELPAEPPPQLRRRRPGRTQTEKKPAGPPDMEDIITGKVDIKELDAYPELAEQMEGMGEVIDMLRGLGEARRKRGEQILREEILGKPAEERPRDDDEDFSF
ncbi:MAG TPA: hypothetical protein VIP09_14915 [Dehalococcoidia bacterium]|jgi:hypothetical protein